LVVRDILGEIDGLAQAVLDQVRARGRPEAIEQTVILGLTRSTEAVLHLSQQLESGRLPRDEAEALAEALSQVDQKLAFFQGCTMRRSSAQAARYGDDAEDYAVEAERLAETARSNGNIHDLVQAYKRLEALEARVVEVRGATKSGAGPELRVLDLPRARVLAARRVIGGAITSLDED